MTMSAFGVEDSRLVSKSETRPGTFMPAADMTRGDRKDLRRRLKTPGAPIGRKLAAPKAKHSVDDVYRGYGIGANGHEFAGAPTRDNPMASMLGEALRPSAVHRKIHYGSSIDSSAEKALDAQIPATLARKSKRPIAIHHSPTMMSTAAAAPAHVTTGGIARVAVSDAKKLSTDGGISGSDVLGHEFVHTMARRNPLNTSPLRNAGDEARADAVSGAHAYVKDGAMRRPSARASQVAAAASKVTGSRTFRRLQDSRVGALANRTASAIEAKSGVENTRSARRYFDVLRKIPKP